MSTYCRAFAMTDRPTGSNEEMGSENGNGSISLALTGS
jgi:hypothetical protein